MKTTDYHDFCHLDTPKEKRDKLFIGNIYINGAECHKCGWFIRSKNKHDMVWCKCEKVAVDGGSHYARRVGEAGSYTDIVVCFNDVKDK